MTGDSGFIATNFVDVFRRQRSVQIRKLIERNNILRKTIYIGDFPPTQISELAGPLPVSRLEGANKTIAWSIDHKGYQIRRR